MKKLDKIDWLTKPLRLYESHDNSWGNYSDWTIGTLSKNLEKKLHVLYNEALIENYKIEELSCIGHRCKGVIHEHTDDMSTRSMVIPVELKCEAVMTLGGIEVRLEEGVPIIFDDFIEHSVWFSDKRVFNTFITVHK